MDDVALALQAALVAALKADAGVAALVGGRVYDEPPQGAALPYVRIGNIDLAPLRMDGAKDHDIMFSVEGHSRPVQGRVEATRLAAAIRAALDETDPGPSVAGFTLEWLQWMTQTVTRDSDGRSYMASVAFQAALSDAP